MVCISLARHGFIRRVGLKIDSYIPGGVNHGFATDPVAHDSVFPSQSCLAHLGPHALVGYG
jgi:hypothetical protein